MADPYDNAEEQWGMRTPAANPYAAPSARVADEPTTALVKSTRLVRLGAVLLDSAVIMVPAILIAIAMPSLGVKQGGSGSEILLGALGLGVIAFFAYQLYLLYANGQTLGKKLLGIKIVRSDGSRAGFWRIVLLRYLLPGVIGAIPFVGFLFGLADPLFIFGEEKRCIHDLFADTIVVDV
ncbi:MAG TPA: RDD family protein [Luteimonas sp.]|nr:RDD family protein [Luteimonas sp.]